MEDSRRSFETCFELLQAGDADGLRRILQQDPAHSEARDSAGVSLLMHSLYRGRRDLAELIASMADRPHLTDVRRILKDNKAVIDKKAGRG